MLSRTELLHLAVNRYFIAINNHDRQTVLDTFAPDCVMRIPSSGFIYDGIAPLTTHFDEFLRTFTKICFSDFTCTVDEKAQRVAVRFRVSLIDAAGTEDVLWNSNFFEVNESGRFSEIIIYTSAPVQRGFEAGSS